MHLYSRAPVRVRMYACTLVRLCACMPVRLCVCAPVRDSIVCLYMKYSVFFGPRFMHKCNSAMRVEGEILRGQDNVNQYSLRKHSGMALGESRPVVAPVQQPVRAHSRALS